MHIHHSGPLGFMVSLVLLKYMSFHHWMGIQSVIANNRKRAEAQKPKTFFVCPCLSSLLVLCVLFCCQLRQVCLEETWSLDAICVIRHANWIYRWETFIFGTVRPQPCKEKHDKITGTIWGCISVFWVFLGFFCSCVKLGSLPQGPSSTV